MSLFSFVKKRILGNSDTDISKSPKNASEPANHTTVVDNEPDLVEINHIEKTSETREQHLEKEGITQQELEVCAYIQTLIAEQGGNTKKLRYQRNSSGYLEVRCFYPFLKIKFSKKGKYILIEETCPIISKYNIEPCTPKEGGADYVRVYFSSPFDLEPLAEYFYKAYIECNNSMNLYESHSDKRMEITEHALRTMCALNNDDVSALLKSAREHDYQPIDVTALETHIVSRNDVSINAVHTRVPLNEIKNLDDSSKGYDMGKPYWEQGDDARIEGDFRKAIELFDLARYNGYDAPVLYESYAKAYRELKDYSNEIVILDEGIMRCPNRASHFEARRDKALTLLFKQQEKERKCAEKDKLKAEKEAQKIVTEPKKPLGRAILQMDDEGNIIKEFESVSSAAREIGISPKSIRDVAKGIQKHAGSFRWKYKDEEEERLR